MSAEGVVSSILQALFDKNGPYETKHSIESAVPFGSVLVCLGECGFICKFIEIPFKYDIVDDRGTIRAMLGYYTASNGKRFFILWNQ